MHFSRTDGSFSTRYTIDADVKEATEIYLNKSIWYSNGFKTVASDDTGAAYDCFIYTSEDGENYLKA